MRNDWGYVGLCLVLPIVWGVASVYVFDWFAARAKKRAEPAPLLERVPEPEAEMYYI